jgi:hypothetical protein
MMRTTLFSSLFWLMATLCLAQPAGTTPPPVSVPPIECWWRTSTSSVRVGELFSVVLTCSVLDTAAVTVVPDQSRLDPLVLQLSPFEVMSGRQAADLRRRGRRFFQYEYTLRYIGEEIGRDVSLPPLSISYKVQNRAEAQGAAIESRDRQYILPERSLRVVSLVPLGARDIRDRAPDTFQAIADRRFRASVLRILGIGLLVVGGVMLAWALLRALTERRASAQGPARLASDGAILGEVARQLEAVERQRQTDGWTPDVLSRALAALRIAGMYAVGGRVAQTPWSPDLELDEGQILVRSRLRPGRTAAVSGSATASVLEREMRRRESRNGQPGGPLAELHPALASLDLAAFGQADLTALDLDGAMASGLRGVESLKREYRSPVRRLKALVRRTLTARARGWIN